MEQTRSQVARAILDYFGKHPDAQDTLSGIAQWWLTDEKVKPRTVTIKEALDDLIADGFVLAQRGKDSQIRFRVNEQRLDEIEKLLKQGLG
jgi:glucose-6-phosphate-specific signal transduction histidine kinase